MGPIKSIITVEASGPVTVDVNKASNTFRYCVIGLVVIFFQAVYLLYLL